MKKKVLQIKLRKLLNRHFARARGSDTIYDVPHHKTTSYAANDVPLLFAWGV
jgi:hypothetical protein